MKHFVEFLAYVRIFLSPLLFFSLLGGLYYWYDKSSTGMAVLVICMVAGMLCGWLLCSFAKKKGGAVNFISKLHATPELDKTKD